MGKDTIKNTFNAVVDTVKNAPKTIGMAAKDTTKALMGKGDGNYLANLGDSALNASVVLGTGGMTGTKDLGGNNSIQSQVKASVLNPGGLDDPTAAPMPDVPADPNLQAELDNAKKKGRASQVLGGGTDSVGGTSARRSLLGGL